MASTGEAALPSGDADLEVDVHRTLSIALALGLGAASATVPAVADEDYGQKGKSTLDETLVRTDTPWRLLEKGPGEAYQLREDMLKAKKARDRKRESMAFFGQLTDPQIVDEMSPARLELVDPVGGPTSAAWRPQEALGVRVFDATIRNMNANSVSRVPDGKGKKAKLKYVILTGDIADSAQFNEVRMFRQTLDGQTVDPYSGKPITPAAAKNCRLGFFGVSPEDVQKANAAVAARKYVGVQDYAYWNAPLSRQNGFWDPNIGGSDNTYGYGNFPTYPNLMDAAQKPMQAEGIKFPWYITRGNHDTLVQGNVPASESLSVSGIPLPLSTIATGCAKPWPNDGVNPETFKGLPGDQVFEELTKPANLEGVVGAMQNGAAVPPDPDRRYVSKVQFKKNVGSGDDRHGFGYVSEKQLKASDGQATYYGFNRGKFRIIMLDTNAEGGGSEGNVDNPQYEWLSKQLDKYSSTKIVDGKVKRDDDKDKLIIISSHHTLGTMDNPTPDEAAGKCDPKVPGTDCDPRNSKPLHYGLKGKKNLKKLLLRYPNVVAYVNGHTHHNAVKAFKQPKSSKYKGGFWQINTASHVDFPQQSRTIQFFDNKDKSLSIFGTVLDTAASVEAPAPGTDANSMSNGQLAALSRVISANDPQYTDVTDGGGLGDVTDRNVELLVKDPRTLWK